VKLQSKTDIIWIIQRYVHHGYDINNYPINYILVPRYNQKICPET